MNPIISRILSNVYCMNCLIFKNYADRIDARNRTLKLNNQYVPDAIKILFVAESPPRAFIWDDRAYFYASGPERRNSIAYHMNQVLFKAKDKEEFFKKFKGNGFYLIDMVKCPLKCLSYRERVQAIECCAKYFNEELHTLKFEKVIFIGKRTSKILKKKRLLTFDIPPALPLPFGNKKNVENFKKELAEKVCVH